MASVVVLSAAASFLATIAGRYFETRAMNAAMKDDLRELTRQVEGVKAEVGHGQWVRERRWEVYGELLDLLDQFTRLYSSMRESSQKLYVAEIELEEFAERFDREWAASSDISQRLFRKMGLAEVVCSEEFVVRMKQFDDEMRTHVREYAAERAALASDNGAIARTLLRLNSCAQKATRELRAIARRDLGFGPASEAEWIAGGP